MSATTGVLFRNADINAIGTSRAKSSRRSPRDPSLANGDASRSMAPERSTPALRTSIAATVIVAALEKPEKASAGARTPLSARAAIVTSAVISMRMTWVTRSARNRPRMTTSVAVGVIGPAVRGRSYRVSPRHLPGQGRAGLGAGRARVPRRPRGPVPRLPVALPARLLASADSVESLEWRFPERLRPVRPTSAAADRIPPWLPASITTSRGDRAGPRRGRGREQRGPRARRVARGSRQARCCCSPTRSMRARMR